MNNTIWRRITTVLDQTHKHNMDTLVVVPTADLALACKPMGDNFKRRGINVLIVDTLAMETYNLLVIRMV